MVPENFYKQQRRNMGKPVHSELIGPSPNNHCEEYMNPFDAAPRQEYFHELHHHAAPSDFRGMEQHGQQPGHPEIYMYDPRPAGNSNHGTDNLFGGHGHRGSSGPMSFVPMYEGPGQPDLDPNERRLQSYHATSFERHHEHRRRKNRKRKTSARRKFGKGWRELFLKTKVQVEMCIVIGILFGVGLRGEYILHYQPEHYGDATKRLVERCLPVAHAVAILAMLYHNIRYCGRNLFGWVFSTVFMGIVGIGVCAYSIWLFPYNPVGTPAFNITARLAQ